MTEKRRAVVFIGTTPAVIWFCWVIGLVYYNQY